MTHEHSPLPWRLGAGRDVLDANGNLVFSPIFDAKFSGREEADLALILESVNARSVDPKLEDVWVRAMNLLSRQSPSGEL